MQREHSHLQDIFAVQVLHNNLLELTAITALHLIYSNAVHQGSADIMERYPKVYGVETLGGDYTIGLEEDA